MPALVVVRQPSGDTHFVVVWRRHGGVVQVMDPATGRRWPSGTQFLGEIYVHTLPVPTAAWYAWGTSDAFVAPLRRRLRHLGLKRLAMDRLVQEALAESDWRALATLDAAARTVAVPIQMATIRRGRQAAGALRAFVSRPHTIPAGYWSVSPLQPMQQKAHTSCSRAPCSSIWPDHASQMLGLTAPSPHSRLNFWPPSQSRQVDPDTPPAS